jgi:drug/metabolite transporter (DMT)-like permease
VSTLSLILCLLCQVLIVAGNLVLKHAMNGTSDSRQSASRIALWLAGGIVLLGLWFFVWLGLLSKAELSQLYAFEGLAPVLLMLSAWFVLGEKVSPRGWAGVVLIGAGLALVAGA